MPRQRSVHPFSRDANGKLSTMAYLLRTSGFLGAAVAENGPGGLLVYPGAESLTCRRPSSAMVAATCT
jgi:hypothetical protein